MEHAMTFGQAIQQHWFKIAARLIGRVLKKRSGPKALADETGPGTLRRTGVTFKRQRKEVKRGA